VNFFLSLERDEAEQSNRLSWSRIIVIALSSDLSDLEENEIKSNEILPYYCHRERGFSGEESLLIEFLALARGKGREKACLRLRIGCVA
jgi:hypothetical protein